MKIKIEFTIDIDADAYAFEYGIENSEVRSDVKSQVTDSAICLFQNLGVLAD